MVTRPNAKRGIALAARWPEIEQLARTRAPDAIGVLADIMMDPNQLGGTRVSAATAILDRGYGKARQSLTVDGSIDINAGHLRALKSLADVVSVEADRLREIDRQAGTRRQDMVIDVIPAEDLDAKTRGLKAVDLDQSVKGGRRGKPQDVQTPNVKARDPDIFR